MVLSSRSPSSLPRSSIRLVVLSMLYVTQAHTHHQLGYTATIANLLSVPVYVWACLVTLAIGFLGDRIGHRAYINL